MSSFTLKTYIYKVVDNLSLSVDVFIPPDFLEKTGVIVLHFHGGFLILTHSNYVRPGQILKVPVNNITKQPEDICRASETGKAIDGYMFPENLSADKRFHWIAALHVVAKIPDILTRIPGLAARINTEGVGVIPESYRALFPATFGITAKLPQVALIHGDRDGFVGFQQSVETGQKLQQHVVKVLLEIAEGQDHGFDVQDDIDVDVVGINGPRFLPNLSRIIKFLEESASNA